MLSNLTAEQKNSLQTMQAVLGLAADMAHGMVTIYLPCEDKKFLQVYKQEQPRTQKGSVRPGNVGSAQYLPGFFLHYGIAYGDCRGSGCDDFLTGTQWYMLFCSDQKEV